MRAASEIAWPWLAALLSATLLFAETAAAKPFDVAGLDWEGCADFVQLARETLGGALKVVDRVDFRELSAEDTLILIHPERRLDDESLSGFIASGGRVILLDDYGTGEALLQRYGIRRQPTPLRPARALRRNADLALAEAIGTHGLVNDVAHVVTNHATTLVAPPLALTPLLSIPNLDGEAGVVALAGIVPTGLSNGHFVVVGDPSIVMNAMLRYPDNKQFADNLIAFAADSGEPGSRHGKIYLASGAFDQKGTFAGSSELASAARRAERALEGARRQGLGPRSTYALATLVGLGIVVWIGSRAGRTYRALVPHFTRSIPLAAQGGAAGHAAVTGDRRAPRALAMYELKKALEEELVLLLGLDVVPAHDILLADIQAARLLDPETLSSLRQLLLRMASIETLLIARRTDALRRIRSAEVLVTATVIKRILGKAHAGFHTRIPA